jgi:hypothetical protein
MEATPQLREIAAKLFWWQEPEAALANQARFFAQLMTLGTWNEVQTVKAAMGWGAFREALRAAPPGVFDERSWNYWHGFFGLPVPGMPQRSLK